MSQNTDQELHDALAQQQKQIQQLNRILWIMLPILSFFLSMIVANWNWLSSIFTFVVLTLAFIAVGIKQVNLAMVLVLTIIYCFVDNYFSYHYQIDTKGLTRQFIMLVFICFVSFGRAFAIQRLIKPQG